MGYEIDGETGLPRLSPGEMWRVGEWGVEVMRQREPSEWTEVDPMFKGFKSWPGTRLETRIRKKSVPVRTFFGKKVKRWEYRDVEEERVHYEPELIHQLVTDQPPRTKEAVLEACIRLLDEREIEKIYGYYPPNKLE